MTSTIRPSWNGFDKVKYLMIFGDSYSDVGYRAQYSSKPTVLDPLGVKFPGITWNESGQPNWVGHLLQKCDAEYPLVVYDYAIGGHTADGVRQQIRMNYLKSTGSKPDWAPWTSQDSLFVIWVGINDCAWIYSYLGTTASHIEVYQTKLFQYVNEVYDTGARNFLFIEVLPMERAPGLAQADTEARAQVYKGWNTALKAGVARFAAEHTDSTAMIFPAFELFHNVLDKPAEYDLNEGTVHEEGGCVWFDHIHITSRMHGIIADAIAEFLNSQAPVNGSEGA